MIESDLASGFFCDMRKAPRDKLFKAFCFQQAGCNVRKYRVFSAGYINNKLHLYWGEPHKDGKFVWARDVGWNPLGWRLEQ